MKKLILFILFSIGGFAQVPQGMSHRGIAYNPSGTILSNTQIIVQVKIFEGSTLGTLVFEEIHTTVNNNPTQPLTTNQNGQYNIVIGNGAQQGSNSFSSINWGNGQKWLEIGIAPASNPTNFVTGSSQLMSVPYALYTEKSSGLNMVTLNTVSELRTLDTHEKENLVYVKGYWYPGDGGGGFFSYKTYLPPEVIPNDNDGTIFKPANANGRWIRQYNGYINARFFGVTKDFENTYSPGFSNSDQIQKAIDYISQLQYSNTLASLTLFFPSGSYLIDKTIILKDKVNILGESGTQFTRYDATYDYMFKLDEGIVSDFSMENVLINLSNLDGTSGIIGGILLKGINSSTNQFGGIWNSRFKNIWIINLTGNGIYLEGGGSTASNGNYSLPNQFLIFENIRIVRSKVSDNYNCLKVRGQLGQVTFLNCTFDGSRTNGTRSNGVNVDISRKDEDDLYSAGLSFINCTIQDSEFGIKIEHADNITLDNCWFENLDLAIQIKKANAVNILNSHFGNAAGFGSIDESLFPPGTGRCIDVEDSSVSVKRNYITVNDPNSPLAQNELFLLSVGNNNTIDISDNQFKDIRLSETFGVIQTTTISNNALILGSKKNIFINVLQGSQAITNQINRIDSSISGGETIFIRANQGSIQINAMDLSGTTNKNIYLNGNSYIILNNGEIAIFKKIDFIVGNEKCTYQLVSVSKNEDSGWNTSISFSNGVTNYDAASTVRCRNKNGVVYLEGNIRGGTTQTNGLTYQLFRLPEGYRPSRKISFPITRANTSITSTVGRIDIDTDGYVFGVNYSNIFSSLSGISFIID